MDKDVKKKTVADIANLQAGYSFRGAIEETANGRVRVLQIKDVSPDTPINWHHVLKTDINSRRTPDWLKAGDLLLLARGVRFYAVCLDEPPGNTVCSPHFFHLRIKPGAEVVPGFIAWQINQAPFQRQLQHAAEGSNQLSIRRPALEAMVLHLPDLATQRRIAELNALAQRERQILCELVRNRDQQLTAMAEILAAPTHDLQPRDAK